MSISASEVKKLRDETGAPMMECKGALTEANGDFEAAKNILREKGAAAAGKRAGRATSEGVVAVAVSDDQKTVGAAILECETDFVARNEDFIALAQRIAEAVRDNEPGADASTLPLDGSTVGAAVEEAVGKIRENIKLAHSVRIAEGKTVGVYVHHDRKKGALVVLDGSGDNLTAVGKQVAIQTVAFPPAYLKKDDVPQDKIAAELEIEKKRAMAEGKPENIAENIAQGRINKEFYQSQVLLEQPFYTDAKLTVATYVKQEAPDATVASYTYLAVGGHGEDAE